QNICNLSVTIYILTVTDANGCTATDSIILTEPPPLTDTLVAILYDTTNISCNGACDGSVTATPAGGTPPYSYVWDSGCVTQTCTLLCAGIYHVTITDANGCFVNDSITLNEPPLPLSVTLTNTGISCDTACANTITAHALGGTAPYVYCWSSSGPVVPCPGPDSLNNICIATYTITVTDLNGCTATASYTFSSAGTPININLSSTNNSCNAACNDTIIATPATGTAPYTYTWSPAAPNSPNYYGACIGTYTVTVTDVNGCSGTASITLISSPVVINISFTPSNYNGWGVTCNGACDGSILATPTSGLAPYSYLWSTSAITQTINGLCAGTYTVTVTDANGCIGTDSFTITEPPLLTATLAGSIFSGGWGVSCNGVCDDTLTTSASGGTLPYTYTWSPPGPNNQLQTGICAGTYTVTVTDVNGCSASASFIVTEPPILTITLAGSNFNGWGEPCSGDCLDTLTSSAAGGTLPYSYTWSNGGPNNPVQTNICAGTYTVTVTDANGCTASASFIVTEPPLLAISLTGSNFNGWGEPCNGDCLDTLTSTATGGTLPYVYSWSNAGPNNPVQTGICAGTYTVTVTDVNGCTASASFVVTEPPVLTVTLTGSNFNGWGEPCNGNCLDTLTTAASGGTLPYTYTWSNGGPNNPVQTGICAGTYTVTVTDVNGCTASASFVVTEPPLLAVTLTGSNFNGWGEPCNGSCLDTLTTAASGGTLPYTYTWSNGGPNNPVQTGICAGTYTVTVTDANGCTATASFIVTEPPAMAVTLTGSNFNGWGEPCNGSCLDTLTTAASGGTLPYTYTWSNAGPNNPVQTGICAGTYTVTVTDANGCTVSASFVVTEPPVLSVTLTGSNFNGWGEPCNGNCLDTLTTTASGGTLPYIYTWSNGGPNNPVQTGICAGTYTVTVTDVNGCTASASFIVTEPPVLTVVLTDTLLNPPFNNSCPGSCDAWILATASGGTLPYSYVWSNGDSTALTDSLCAGLYTVTITDANGCIRIDTLTITDPLQPTAVAGPDQSICANSTTLIANVPLPFYSAYWYVVSGSAIFSPDSLSNVVQVSNLSWGTNTFVWFVGDTLCIARDTIIIQATEPVIAIADKYPNICEGDEPVHLHANTNYTGIGTWSVIPSTSSLSFDNPNDPNTFASNFGWGSNTVVWTVVDGPCRDADTVKIIKLIPEVCDSTLLEMPTGFSPNGDGDNDHFVIHGIEYSYNRINKFTVFNRWGNEVYSKENYLNEWFGQNKSGGLLADGTYFVILRITNPGINQGRVLKGYVDLRR
ncbi:MAG: gliding motility-associated C-terminal domain-containing protein, partial [Bacteroidia bacterium]|nr:gliding motility-associated C-terminal domain-containing protein [Bacteroidia bacterium]